MPPAHEELRIIDINKARTVVPKECPPPHPPKTILGLKHETHGLGVPIHSFWEIISATLVDGN
jgi:hypothetical protein